MTSFLTDCSWKENGRTVPAFPLNKLLLLAWSPCWSTLPHYIHGHGRRFLTIRSLLLTDKELSIFSFAAIFATLPIAIGFAVVGRLQLSQFLTLYITPTFYVSMARIARPFDWIPGQARNDEVHTISWPHR